MNTEQRSVPKSLVPGGPSLRQGSGVVGGVASLALALVSCAGSAAKPAPESSVAAGAEAIAAERSVAAGVEATGPGADQGLGGRLVDRWYRELKLDLKPGKKGEPGSGGPRGDGTMLTARGEPMAPGGHAYRIKNLLGWDLRGAEGIYGADYQDKSYVLAINALTGDEDAARWTARLAEGRDGFPALGELLSAAQLEVMVDFLLGVREGRLARPDQVWALSKQAPKNYTLLPGGDPERGRDFYGRTCARCHGGDGAAILFDDGGYSLGMYGRAKAYEAWFKVLAGQPGTPMHAQLPAGLGGSAQSALLLDLFAALCDRQAFPPGDGSKSDVPDGDLRCGSYLR